MARPAPRAGPARVLSLSASLPCSARLGSARLGSTRLRGVQYSYGAMIGHYCTPGNQPFWGSICRIHVDWLVGL